MAPVKPMGTDRNPKTRPGVTGFEQAYNEEAPPSQDLNPDAVADPSALPEPQKASRGSNAKGPRKARKSRK